MQNLLYHPSGQVPRYVSQSSIICTFITANSTQVHTKETVQTNPTK